MTRSTIRALVPGDVDRVWQVVTDVEHYGWRSDLSRTERLDDRRFVEYTKEGFATTFTVTDWEPCRRWAFDMDNENIQGSWTGIFTAQGGKTEVVFTEEVSAKRFWMRPFLGLYLRRQQRQFLEELKKALT